MKISFKKKVVAGALAAGMVMGAGGIAAAYFGASGSGTATPTVGNSVPLSVKQTNVYYQTATGTSVGALYPTGLAQPVFTIQNVAVFPEHATTTVGDFAIVTDGDTIAATKTGTNAVIGCKASWFTISANGTTTVTVTLGKHGSGTTSVNASVDVNMATTGTQLACAGKQPIVALSFTS